jgi:hypothetical protein
MATPQAILNEAGMTDTTDIAQALQDDIRRRMTPSDRLRLAFEMSALTRALALAGLRTRHPQWTDAECQRELLRYAFLPAPLPPGLP